MKVSVITTTYNDAHMMDRCLQSIRDQRVPYDEVEHIVWDDGSDDLADLKRMQSLYPHAKFFLGNGNVGLGAARNLACKEATGDAFLFLDADDHFSLNTVSDMVKASRNGERGGPIYPTVQHTNKMTTLRKPGKWTVEKACKDLFIPASSMVMRKDFEAAGGFTEGLPLFEDFDLWFRLAKAGVEGYYCGSAVLYYNIREDSMSDHFDIEGMSATKREIYQRIVNQ